MSAGIVSRHGQVGGLIGAAGMLQIDAPIAGGNSGGVVVNGRGEAVGLVSHSAGPFTQAVPIGRAPWPWRACRGNQEQQGRPGRRLFASGPASSELAMQAAPSRPCMAGPRRDFAGVLDIGRVGRSFGVGQERGQGLGTGQALGGS
jgi:hypothetical protein